MNSTRIRAAGIVIHEDAVLLIERRKGGERYWVFPGGGVEEGETQEEAVVREVSEETSVVVSSPQFFASCINDGQYGDSYFYTCTFVAGVPALSEKSPEYKRMAAEKENEYHPQWVPMSHLHLLQVFPQAIAEQLIREHGLEEGVQK